MGRASQGLVRIRTRDGYQGFIAVVLVLVAAGAVMGWAFEHEEPTGNIDSIGDAFWWAFSTTTTVGYGDFVPVTIEGRAVAGGLMLLGIGVIAVVTANVAAYFLETDRPGGTEELEDRLERIEAKLDQLLNGGTGSLS